MRKMHVRGITALACAAVLATAVPAQAQHGRARPVIRPVRPYFSIRAHVGAYYGPYFYTPWSYGYWNAFYGYPYYYYWGTDTASLRVQVRPKTARVYVDGAFAGLVDDYDGFWQRLTLEPGNREITVYLEGHRSIVERLYVSPGGNYSIKGVLEPLPAGAPDEPRPEPRWAGTSARPGLRYGEPREVPPSSERPDSRPPRESYPPADAGPPAPDVRAPDQPLPPDGRFGQLAIRVQPPDAQVTIDGEEWRAPEGAERLVVHLPAGTHRVEIRKEGFDPFVTSVEIRRGEVAALNVSLARL
ncbi:MAG TPA: PEGA domain-containing protein [Vicinamibacterales bacterium]|nr:PEGA domain-containing protein [Vicinamibacterales bacterium]HPW21287.1 PEGA domain-containing protein [Vicinamibacterales bacterium]